LFASTLRRRLSAVTVFLLVATGLAVATPAAAVPVPSAGHAAIYGVVTPDTGASFSGQIQIEVLTTEGSAGFAVADPSGAFELDAVSPGTYRLKFVYVGTGPWASTYWAPPGGAEGGVFAVVAGEVLEANGPLHIGGSISGTVKVPTGVSKVVSVSAYDSNGDIVGRATSSATGYYVIRGLPAGNYRVEFAQTGGLLYYEYWSNAPSLETATPVAVAYATTTTGISPTMTGIGVITGIVTYELPGGGTAPLSGGTVQLLRISDYASWTATTDKDGRYILDAVGMQDFVLRFSAPTGRNLASEYWRDAAVQSEATVLSNPAGTIMAGYDVTLSPEARITGLVQYDLGTVKNLAGATVSLYREDPHGNFTPFQENFEVTTYSSGNFSFENLPAGNYVVKASDNSARGLAAEYWKNSRFLSGATVLSLEEGETAALGTMVLEPLDIATKRLSGPDRFATGVAITQTQFPTTASHSVPVVYVASGLNYPDALTAGPAAIAQGGALLLVLPTSIPDVVAAELDRLNPQRIVVVGSTAAISSTVKTQLAQYSSNVDRLGGANRFETSALVVRDAFEDAGSRTAYFATGLNFPDALAAGPAAAQFGAPIILVNGLASDLDAGTADLMRDLGVGDAELVGSSVALSNGVANDIAANLTPYGPFDLTSMHRNEGPNRYATAVAVNEWAFPLGADEALIATGTGFADALSGGPLAGAWGIPMYLSTPTCLPEETLQSMVDLEVARVWLLGGTVTLSNNVKNLGTC
jgi:putative cell wall-binding protein